MEKECKFVQEFEFDSGEVISIHIGQFFGISDLRIRTKSKGRLLLILDEIPTDLIEKQSPKSCPDEVEVETNPSGRGEPI